MSMTQSPSPSLWTHEAIHVNLAAIPFQKKSRSCVGCRFTYTAPRRHKGEHRSQFTSVPVRVAHELVQAGHHFLDVRSPQEFCTGHVHGALNVPFLITLPPGHVDMFVNPDFIPQVSSLFHKDDEILIGCQTGNLSPMAVHQLLSAGFTGILDMAGGYNAWIQGELPAQL